MKTYLSIIFLLSSFITLADDPVRPEIYQYSGNDKDLKEVTLLLFQNADKELSGYLEINSKKDTLVSVSKSGTDFTFKSKKGWTAEGKNLTEDEVKIKMLKNGEKFKVKLQKTEPDSDWEMSGEYTYRSGPFTDATFLIIRQMEGDKIYFSLHYQTDNMVIKGKYVDQWGYAKRTGSNTYRYHSNFVKCYGTDGCDFTFKRDDNGKIIFSNNSECEDCLYGLNKGDNIYFETPRK